MNKSDSKNCFYLFPFLQFFNVKYVSFSGDISWEQFQKEYLYISKYTQVKSVIINYLVFLKKDQLDEVIIDEFKSKKNCSLHEKGRQEYEEYLKLWKLHQKLYPST